MSDLLSLRARFRAFGFVVLPAALDAVEAVALAADAKVVAYTDELDAGMGALRVLPGSHRLDERVLVDVLHGPVFREEATVAQATREVPGYVVGSRPGDVVVFDERLWHASVDGRSRHQWSATFVLDPGTPEDEFAARRYLASQFSPGYELDYDPTQYPHYGAGLRSAGVPARWWQRLQELGAAEAEQLGKTGH